jgi:DNA-binding NarL/FixJ family response regulator
VTPAELALSRVLLVDDHRIFAEVLAARLRGLRCFDAVHVAFSIDEARAQLRAHPPDLVLLDFHLGEESGLGLLRHLGAHHPPVAVISSSIDPAEITEALNAGVDGWLVKHASIEELLTASEALLSGDMFLSPHVVRPLVAWLLEGASGHTRPHTFVDDLTPRELEVLRCLVAGMNRTQVAARLFVSTNTVRTHVQHLLKGAGVHSTLALIAEARAAGVPPIDEPALPDPRPWSE